MITPEKLADIILKHTYERRHSMTVWKDYEAMAKEINKEFKNEKKDPKRNG